MIGGPPTSIIIGPVGHGVVRHARVIARATGATVVRRRRASGDAASSMPRPTGITHLHFTDRLFGDDVGTAAERFVGLAATLDTPKVVTVHDIPGSGAEERSRRRRQAYRRVIETVDAVIVTASHERDRVAALGTSRPIHVVPFPIALARRAPARTTPTGPSTRQLGVLGYVYPGKGHDTAVRVAGRIGELDVIAMGTVSPGHDELAEHLGRSARSGGGRLTITGRLGEAVLADHLASVDVPFAVYADVSASMSIVTWIGAGRRPIVASGPFVAELDDQAPGCLTIVDGDDADAVHHAVDEALSDPATTHANTVPEHLSPAGIGRRHLAIYEALRCAS